MYVSAGGLVVSGVIGMAAGIGTAVAAKKSVIGGAAIGLVGGVALPLIADGVTGALNPERAAAVTALKKLRAAIVDKKPAEAATAMGEVNQAVAKLQVIQGGKSDQAAAPAKAA